jgi:hypothetical protein
MVEESLPASVAKKATNLIRDSRQAIMVGLIPLLGLIFILRLVQWYLLKRQYPMLTSSDAGERSDLAKDFRSALPRLWFAVLFWPAFVLFIIAYFSIT